MDQNVPTPTSFKPLDPQKFQNPDTTAKGERRATVALNRLETLWFNTGTLCNIECKNCYIESSPANDRLVYLSPAEVAAYLDEAAALDQRPKTVGFTGGEPFMNPNIADILEAALSRVEPGMAGTLRTGRDCRAGARSPCASCGAAGQAGECCVSSG